MDKCGFVPLIRGSMKKKSGASQAGLEKLKGDLEKKALRPLYVFHDEEAYLREYYLKELKALALPQGADAFNYHEFSGKNVDVDDLEEAIDSFPMMSARSFVLISDWDIFKIGEAQKKKILEILTDLPDYCTIVLYYDLFSYQPDGRTKIASTLGKVALEVEFPFQEEEILLSWIQSKRFALHQKRISTETAREFLFYCGNSMTNLASEIDKISAYAQGEEITFQDIQAVATPHLNAIVFQMTDAIATNNFDQAMKILGDLFQIQEKGSPRNKELGILGAISRQIRHIYMAKLAIEGGKGESYVASLLSVQSFVARRVLSSANRFSLLWCRQAVMLCGQTDYRMKSSSEDGEALLTNLLLELAQGNTSMR